ncbi:MAG: hypothetical protein ACRD8K_02360, partial [Nitrososphaeraceae archaeon]
GGTGTQYKAIAESKANKTAILSYGTGYNNTDRRIELTNKKLPTWDDYYKNEIIEKMYWYNEKLDCNLEEELNTMQLNKGNFSRSGYWSKNSSNTTPK